MSNSNIPWAGKGGRFLGLMNFLNSFTDNLEMWEIQDQGTLRVRPAMYRDCMPFSLSLKLHS